MARVNRACRELPSNQQTLKYPQSTVLEGLLAGKDVGEKYNFIDGDFSCGYRDPTRRKVKVSRQNWTPGLDDYRLSSLCRMDLSDDHIYWIA